MQSVPLIVSGQSSVWRVKCSWTGSCHETKPDFRCGAKCASRCFAASCDGEILLRKEAFSMLKIRKLKTKELTMLSLLIALNVVMAELLKIKIIPNVLELSFGFIPIAVTAMLFGPVGAVVVAVIADIIGALLFAGGNFFFGYTLTACCTGLFYGLLLYEKPTKKWQIFLAQALVSLISYAWLNTMWAYYMGYARTWEYIFTRLLVNVIAYPVYSLMLIFLSKYRKVLEKAVK